MKTANISLGGAYCHIDHYIPEMTKLGLRIRVDDSEESRSEWISIDAVVVRIDPNRRDAEDYHVAMFFTNMTSEIKNKLNELLS